MSEPSYQPRLERWTDRELEWQEALLVRRLDEQLQQPLTERAYAERARMRNSLARVRGEMSRRRHQEHLGWLQREGEGLS